MARFRYKAVSRVRIYLSKLQGLRGPTLSASDRNELDDLAIVAAIASLRARGGSTERQEKALRKKLRRVLGHTFP